MQEVHALLDLTWLILDPHHKAGHRQPTHDKQGQQQPVVGPQRNITMDAGRNKRGGIQPDMIDKESVEIGLYVFQAVPQANPFGREVDVCGKEEDQGQITGAGCQVVIGVVCIYDRQQQETADKYGLFLERPIAK